MSLSRHPAVAGSFYPDDARTLEAGVRRFLREVMPTGPAPKALIAPHAGYVYSGPIAASVYGLLRDARADITRVVLLGPAHRVPVSGLAASSASAFDTPLGEVPVDEEAMARVLELPQVRILDQAHSQEHSLEVHLPFLQVVLSSFSLVPLVVGNAEPDEVAEVIETLWGGPETLIVISSDLSHYHDYESARRLDEVTSDAIERLAPKDIGHDQACGRHSINGLLTVARRRGLNVRTLDLRNSGDTAGPRDRVVGYGAYAFA